MSKQANKRETKRTRERERDRDNIWSVKEHQYILLHNNINGNVECTILLKALLTLYSDIFLCVSLGFGTCMKFGSYLRYLCVCALRFVLFIIYRRYILFVFHGISLKSPKLIEDFNGNDGHWVWILSSVVSAHAQTIWYQNIIMNFIFIVLWRGITWQSHKSSFSIDFISFSSMFICVISSNVMVCYLICVYRTICVVQMEGDSVHYSMPQCSCLNGQMKGNDNF